VLSRNNLQIRPAIVAAVLGELHAAGLAAVDDHDQDKLTGRWTALPVARDPMLDAVDLHGAHHLCHTYTTWLEDAGILIRTRLKPPESVSAQSALVGTGVIC